jgi:peptidoglycan/LPS O-acetylase OafA/YrhL
MERSKIEILDGLRAIAALSVCLFHFVCTTTGYIQNKVVLQIFDVGQYGVQLFFVISGFVIPWAMYHGGYQLKNFFSFLLKRLARLEPPYFFSIVLVLLALYARERFYGEENSHMQVSATQVALHLGYLIPFFKGYKWLNSVYWTLAVEFQYYFFVAFLFVPLIRSNQIFRGILYIAIGALSFAFPENFLPYWLPLFFLGILLFLYKVDLIGKPEYFIASLAFVVLSFFKYPAAAVVYALIPVVCVLLWPNSRIPLLQKVGKFSYSVYLIHPVIGASLVNVLSHRFVSPSAKFVVICCGIAVTLVGSWLTYLLVEKPSKRLSSAIKYK